MQLTFSQPHLSIVDFPPASLPQFTLITGVNGAGKTHLLKAIDEGKIRVDVAPSFQTQARYFDWNNLVPADQNEFDGHSLVQQRNQYFTQFDAQFQAHKQQLTQVARTLNLPRDLLQNPKRLASLSRDDLALHVPADTLDQAFQQLQAAQNAVSTNILNSGFRGNTHAHQMFQSLSQNRQRPIASLRRSDFFDDIPVSWGQTDLFQQSLAQLFVAYRDQRIANDLKRLAQQDGDQDAEPLSQDEFEAQYNVPPWDFVNRVLRDANLGFQVDQPERYQLTPYRPQLTKMSTGVPIRFGDLSSGEKVLMSFALCIYYAEDRRQVARYPTLLLLDEIDAPLHPSMTRSLVETITSTLVGEFGINVIMTTHSSSTVAIAPEESIHVMDPNRPGVHRESKSRALNILTDGIPTLSIAFSGRRQVFVESTNDAAVYDTVYQSIRTRIDSERSLAFIPVGHRPLEGGDQNAGCAQVRRIVQALNEGGNNSVVGLVDWDGDRNPSDRVMVLAHGERNGIENCIFDPLLIAIHVARDARARRNQVGITDTENYVDIPHLPIARLQQIVDAVCQTMGTTGSEHQPQQYAGGLVLDIPIAHLQMDDHQLESQVLTTFPEFNHFNRHGGDLVRHFASTSMTDFPLLIPNAFLATFEQLLHLEL